MYNNAQDRSDRRQPKYKLGQLVRTADIGRVFIKGDITNYSYEHYKVTQIVHDTIPSLKFNYKTERYNQSLLLPAKLSLEENNQVVKKLNLIQ